jgi:hypothetical protein
MPPAAEYTFKHALVQDAAYSTLLRSRRQQLHARIAETLESQFPEVVTAQPALIAHHSTEAGLSEKAVGYWLKAGQQAIARSAMMEAVAQLQKGLELHHPRDNRSRALGSTAVHPARSIATSASVGSTSMSALTMLRGLLSCRSWPISAKRAPSHSSRPPLPITATSTFASSG